MSSKIKSFIYSCIMFMFMFGGYFGLKMYAEYEESGWLYELMLQENPYFYFVSLGIGAIIGIIFLFIYKRNEGRDTFG